jgi:AraC-like DNA-binding protein
MADNPSLRETLTTKGRRGANIWVFIDGRFPATRHLKFNGERVGEWRAEGAQTLIAGSHPEGGNYTTLVQSTPMRIRYNSIKWNGVESSDAPALFASPSPLLPSSVFSEPSVSSILSTSSTSSTSPPSLGEKIRASKAAKEALSGSLKRQYVRYIEKRFIPKQGARNSSLVAMVTFLYRATGVSQLRQLAAAFYDLNQEIFTDSREQHMEELEAHMRACQSTWLGELSQEEISFISDLPEEYVDAFRICRDLAHHENEASPPPDFFLSCNDLGDRLGCSPSTAQRILNAFESASQIKMILKGIRREAGVAGVASSYRWLAAVTVAASVFMICVRPLSNMFEWFPNQTPLQTAP